MRIDVTSYVEVVTRRSLAANMHVESNRGVFVGEDRRVAVLLICYW